jgi:hypothetical protein
MNDLNFVVCQKGFQKVKKVFAQNRAVRASDEGKPDCHGASPLAARCLSEPRWKPSLPVQPLHVIAHAIFERKPRFVPERFARAG